MTDTAPTSPLNGGGEPAAHRPHALRSAAWLTAGYAATALAWMLVSAMLLWGEIVSTARAMVIVVANGALFLVFTTAVLFAVIHRHLKQLDDAESRFIKAQTELRQKDLAVRQGYVDVLDAVTGGKLILVTDDELRATLGTVILPPRELTSPKELSDARRQIDECISSVHLADKDGVMLAVSEALTNAIKHGGRGEYSISTSGPCIQIVVRDFGSGIDFRELPKATLIQGFSTTSTMGLGFTIMLEVADRVLLTTDSAGTVVVLEIETIEAPEPAERSLETILTAV